MITITDDEHQRALQYAAASLDYTWDRMNYEGLQNAAQTRLQHVYVGKAVEFATLRTLRDERGLNLDPDPVATPHTDPDRADWILTTNNSGRLPVDMKSFHIFRRFRDEERTCESIEQRIRALVPQDQVQRHPKSIYIFASLLGDLGRKDHQTGSPMLEIDACICDIRWETLDNVREWEQIATGTRLYPYAATRTANFGSLMHGLRTPDSLDRL